MGEPAILNKMNTSDEEVGSPHIRTATLIPNTARIGELFAYWSNSVSVHSYFETIENLFNMQNPTSPTKNVLAHDGSGTSKSSLVGKDLKEKSKMNISE